MEFPLNITDDAIKQLIAARELDDDIDSFYVVRISCQPGGCAGFRHDIDFDDEVFSNDLACEYTSQENNIQVVLDPMSAKLLKGTTLNFISSDWNEGFRFIGGDHLGRSCACGQSANYDCNIAEVNDELESRNVVG